MIHRLTHTPGGIQEHPWSNNPQVARCHHGVAASYSKSGRSDRSISSSLEEDCAGGAPPNPPKPPGIPPPPMAGPSLAINFWRKGPTSGSDISCCSLAGLAMRPPTPPGSEIKLWKAAMTLGFCIPAASSVCVRYGRGQWNSLEYCWKREKLTTISKLTRIRHQNLHHINGIV